MGFFNDLKRHIFANTPSYTGTFNVEKPFEEANQIVDEVLSKFWGTPMLRPTISKSLLEGRAGYRVVSNDGIKLGEISVIKVEENVTKVTAQINSTSKTADIDFENFQKKVLEK